jgi:hypothetical protein
MKMLVLIGGGLDNQLFKYAFDPSAVVSHRPCKECLDGMSDEI